MMTREQYIRRVDEIAAQTAESRRRQHEQCRAADDERIRVQQALTAAKDAYVVRYHDEMRAAQKSCADTCQNIRYREENLRLRLNAERMALDYAWSSCRQGDADLSAAAGKGGEL